MLYGVPSDDLKHFKLDQIQKGRLLAIINFKMSDIWKTVPDS